MNDDLLQDIWDQRPEEPKMSRAQLEDLLSPHVTRSATGWSVQIWIYLTFIAGTLVCEGMHLYAYRGDPLILSLSLTATLLTLGFLAYGVRLLRRFSTIGGAHEPLVLQLRRRLHLYGTQYEAWLWMLALTFVFLSLAVSTLADIEDGTYRINKPVVFAGLVVAQLLFGYGAVKLGQLPFVRESRAILSDLENQVTSGTEAVQERKRVWRKWTVVLVILLTALMVFGLVRALG